MRRHDFFRYDFLLGGLFMACLFGAVFLVFRPLGFSAWVWWVLIASCLAGAWVAAALRASGIQGQVSDGEENPQGEPSDEGRANGGAEGDANEGRREQHQDTDVGRPIRDDFVFITSLTTGTRAMFSWCEAHSDLATVFFTAAVATFTLGLWRSTDSLWEAGEKQTIAMQRAWLGPTGAFIEPPVIGSGVKVTVAFTNTGKEPAEFIKIIDSKVFTIEDWYNGKAAYNIIAFKDSCMGIKDIAPNEIAYPLTGANPYTARFDTGEVLPGGKAYLADKDLTDNKSILAATGCFIYVTVNAVHHSAFCFFYDSKHTVVPNLNICTVGNKAD